MSLEDNKDIVRRYQEIYNSNELDALGEVVAGDVLTPRIMAGMPPGLDGEKVAARITMTGTHSGVFWGIPATGKRVEFTRIYIVRITGGKIVEHWGEEDGVSLLQQLEVFEM